MARSRYAVFGAGRYGTQIALSLAQRGAEVFTFDADPGRAELLKEDVALAVTLDATDKKALMAQHVEDLDAAVVAIGENFEATVLTTLNLLDLGLPRVIVRANDANQERILRSLGVTDILRPESEVAEVVSERLINPNIRGFLTLRTTTKSRKSKPRGVSRTSLGGHGLGEPLRIAVDHHPTRIQGNGRRRGPLRGNTSWACPSPTPPLKPRTPWWCLAPSGRFSGSWTSTADVATRAGR